MFLVRKFGADRRGVTLIEYALIAGIVSIAAFSVLVAMGGSLRALYSSVNTQVSTAAANIP